MIKEKYEHIIDKKEMQNMISCFNEIIEKAYLKGKIDVLENIEETVVKIRPETISQLPKYITDLKDKQKRIPKGLTEKFVIKTIGKSSNKLLTFQEIVNSRKEPEELQISDKTIYACLYHGSKKGLFVKNTESQWTIKENRKTA